MLRRCSPEVRIMRSGSGIPAVSRPEANMSQSMAEGSISPRAAFWASSLAAFAASARDP